MRPRIISGFARFRSSFASVDFLEQSARPCDVQYSSTPTISGPRAIRSPTRTNASPYRSLPDREGHRAPLHTHEHRRQRWLFSRSEHLDFGTFRDDDDSVLGHRIVQAILLQIEPNHRVRRMCTSLSMMQRRSFACRPILTRSKSTHSSTHWRIDAASNPRHALRSDQAARDDAPVRNERIGCDPDPRLCFIAGKQIWQIVGRARSNRPTRVVEIELATFGSRNGLRCQYAVDGSDVCASSPLHARLPWDARFGKVERENIPPLAHKMRRVTPCKSCSLSTRRASLPVTV